MTFRMLNGRVDGILAMSPKLKLIKSSCRTKTEARRLTAVAVKSPPGVSSVLLMRPPAMTLAAKVTAMRMRYGVSQWRQNRFAQLERDFNGCEVYVVGRWPSTHPVSDTSFF